MISREHIVVGQKDGLRQGVAAAFPAGSEQGVLFRVGDEFFAVRNRCPHQQFEMLHEGHVVGYTVTCPMHGWQFDLRTGASVNVNSGGKLKTWKTEVLGKDVVVHCEGDC